MTTSHATAPPAKAPADRRKRWTTAEFDRLVSEGFLREGSRTYLWDFEIIEPMPENPPHVNAVANLGEALRARFPAGAWTVNQGAPLALMEGYKPQPDVTVLKGPRSSFRGRTPAPADVALLAEVSDSTDHDDVGDFLRKYAARGIPQYWVVNIASRRVEVYTAPEGGATGDRDRKDYGLDERVPLVIELDGVITDYGAVAVRDVLGDSLEPAEEGRGA